MSLECACRQVQWPLAFVALLLAACAAPAAANPPGHPYGPDYTPHPLRDDALGAWAAGHPFAPAHEELGTTMSRLPVHWADTQPDSAYIFEQFYEEHLATAVDSLGLSVVLTLRNHHDDYIDYAGCDTSDGHPSGLPLDMEWYGQWVYELAAFFSGKGIRHFQVENEVYGGPNKYWCGDWLDYLGLLDVASLAIREAGGGSAIVIPAGFANNLYTAWSDTTYFPPEMALQVMLNHPDRWDMLDLHLYGDPLDVDDAGFWLRQRLDGLGLLEKLLITTECGGPDLRIHVPYDPVRHTWEVVQRPCLTMANSFDHMILWHIKAPDSANENFRNMSLVDSLGVEKPAFYAFDTFLDFVGDAVAVQRVEVSDNWEETHLYRWDVLSQSEPSICIAWSWANDESGETIPLPGACQQQPYYDLYGVQQGTTGDTFEFLPQPVYIRWDPLASDVREGQPQRLPEVSFTIEPNPFARSAQVCFVVKPGGEQVDLQVFDLEGRCLRALQSGHLPAGEHEVTWDGHDESGRPVASGLYYCTLAKGEDLRSRKVIALR